MPPKSSVVTESRTLAALADLPLFQQGCPSNNMAPRKSIVPPDPAVTVLAQGLDTLILNVYGVLREDVADCLAMAKDEALACPTGEADSPLPPFDGVVPRMQERGVPYYPYRLVSRDVTVLIAPPGRSKRPNAVIKVSSECLWRLGGGGSAAARLAAGYLLSLFDGLPRVQVARADLATDYQGHVPSMADRRGIVKRARKVRDYFTPDDEGLEWYSLNDEAASFAAGRSNTIRVSGYDKTAEIKTSGKDWFFNIWERHKGYVPGVPVWRNEFQFGREVLRERGIETVEELLAALAGLWAYGMGWFSFRTVNPGDMGHKSRWPVAPWWMALTPWRGGDSEPLPKVKVVRPGFNRLSQGLMGYMTSVMAVTERLDPYEAVSEVIRHILATRGPTALDEALEKKQLRYRGFTMAG